MKLRKTSKYLILYSGYTVGVARFNSADDQLTELFLFTQKPFMEEANLFASYKSNLKGTFNKKGNSF